jgi:serine/threonine protein kinase
LKQAALAAYSLPVLIADPVRSALTRTVTVQVADLTRFEYGCCRSAFALDLIDYALGCADRHTGAMPSLSAGMRLGERFTVRDRIGVGGMSQVWRAEDNVLGRLVAVKVLTAAMAADPALRTATWTEARAAARLAHPHVTQVYDYGEASLPDGGVLPYLVMELVDGQSLADRLRSGPLPWRQAVSVCADVAAAVAAAHRIGVVHRDVKPGNVMLTSAGAKVLDFGVAVLAGGPAMAHGGRLVGTPAYAAPERLQPGAARPESDVYALGVLLYESLCGRLPIALTTWPDAAAAHHVGAAVPEPDVVGLPDQIRRLCSACRSHDPGQRPTAEQVAQTLAGAAGPLIATSDQHTAVEKRPVPPAGATYAVGSASVRHHPPTMIDHGMLAPPEAPHLAQPRPISRPVLLGLIGAILVLGLALVIAMANRPTSAPRQTGQPAAPATVRTTPAPPVSPTPTPTPTATTPSAIADELDATIAAALAAGRIDSDAAKSLQDKVKDLRESHNQHKAGKSADEVQERVDELLGDGKIDQQTADQLATALQPLLVTNE